MADETFAFVFILFLAHSGCVLYRINQKENAPYMDEVFHIPQVQNYCVGRFYQWDPMITTLPGLYVATVGIIEPIHRLFQIPIEVICSTEWLRCINIVFAAGNLYLLFHLVRKLHGENEDYEPGRGLLKAFTLSLFPVLHFFTFLYYTDSGSTFCVLLMYLLNLYGNHKMAAYVGGVAVFFRQTNIIWVIFVAGRTAAETLLDRMQPDKKEVSPESMQGLGFAQIVLGYVWSLLKLNKNAFAVLVWDIIRPCWAYILIGITFACFVFINGSIVVGAKDDHEAIFHVPQIFYFASFSFLFSIMHHLSWIRAKQFMLFLYQKALFVALFCLVSAVLVWKFTYAHRYLLADNRHYTFYVWAKIYRRHEMVKYAAIPGYLCALWNLFKALEHKNVLWKVIFCLCVMLNLVPAQLLEFRYFIVPYLLYRLNMSLASYKRLGLELLLYSIVNSSTLFLFLERPFQWDNVSGNQRFMW